MNKFALQFLVHEKQGVIPKFQWKVTPIDAREPVRTVRLPQDKRTASIHRSETDQCVPTRLVVETLIACNVQPTVELSVATKLTTLFEEM